MAKNKNNIKSNANRLREEFYKGMAELKERQEKIDARIDKLLKAQEERDAAIDKLLKAQEKTDEQMKKTDAEIDKLLKAQEETSKQMRETDERMKKTDERIAKTSEEIDKLKDSVRKVSDGYGRFVVGIVSPSAVKYFSQFGYKIMGTAFQKTIYENKIPFAEYDVFIESILNEKRYIIIGEAKTHCSSTDIDEFIERIKKLSKIVIYEGIIKIGFVAAVSYGEGADKYAIKNGLYVFKVTDEIMEVKVPPDFIPTEFQ